MIRYKSNDIVTYFCSTTDEDNNITVSEVTTADKGHKRVCVKYHNSTTSYGLTTDTTASEYSPKLNMYGSDFYFGKLGDRKTLTTNLNVTNALNSDIIKANSIVSGTINKVIDALYTYGYSSSYLHDGLYKLDYDDLNCISESYVEAFIFSKSTTTSAFKTTIYYTSDAATSEYIPESVSSITSKNLLAFDKYRYNTNIFFSDDKIMYSSYQIVACKIKSTLSYREGAVIDYTHPYSGSLTSFTNYLGETSTAYYMQHLYFRKSDGALSNISSYFSNIQTKTTYITNLDICRFYPLSSYINYGETTSCYIGVGQYDSFLSFNNIMITAARTSYKYTLKPSLLVGSTYASRFSFTPCSELSNIDNNIISFSCDLNVSSTNTSFLFSKSQRYNNYYSQTESYYLSLSSSIIYRFTKRRYTMTGNLIYEITNTSKSSLSSTNHETFIKKNHVYSFKSKIDTDLYYKTVTNASCSFEEIDDYSLTTSYITYDFTISKFDNENYSIINTTTYGASISTQVNTTYTTDIPFAQAVLFSHGVQTYASYTPNSLFGTYKSNTRSYPQFHNYMNTNYYSYEKSGFASMYYYSDIINSSLKKTIMNLSDYISDTNNLTAKTLYYQLEFDNETITYSNGNLVPYKDANYYVAGYTYTYQSTATSYFLKSFKFKLDPILSTKVNYLYIGYEEDYDNNFLNNSDMESIEFNNYNTCIYIPYNAAINTINNTGIIKLLKFVTSVNGGVTLRNKSTISTYTSTVLNELFTSKTDVILPKYTYTYVTIPYYSISRVPNINI